MKICPKCEELKDFDEYYRHKSYKDGLQPQCKSCWSKYCSSEERKIKRRKYNLNSDMASRRRDYSRSWQLMRKYGITLERYNEMLKSQNSRCAVCDKHQLDCYNGLYVDHNHSTKEVRQLLCRDCNAGIGFFKENSDILAKALAYLRRHNRKLSVVKG